MAQTLMRYVAFLRAVKLGKNATFLASEPSEIVVLPVVSRKGDIILFEIRNRVALSHRIRINGSAGDANAFVERRLGVSATSRSWNTVQGIIGKYA